MSECTGPGCGHASHAAANQFRPEGAGAVALPRTATPNAGPQTPTECVDALERYVGGEIVRRVRRLPPRLDGIARLEQVKVYAGGMAGPMVDLVEPLARHRFEARCGRVKTSRRRDPRLGYPWWELTVDLRDVAVVWPAAVPPVPKYDKPKGGDDAGR